MGPPFVRQGGHSSQSKSMLFGCHPFSADDCQIAMPETSIEKNTTIEP